MKCKNCGHEIIKVDNGYLHYNRKEFGAKAINHKWCSKCEVETISQRSHNMEEVCDKPEPIKKEV